MISTTNTKTIISDATTKSKTSTNTKTEPVSSVTTLYPLITSGSYINTICLLVILIVKLCTQFA